ncbi:MAG: cupin domain-containing protein [Verrucomicrobiia bacterium]
MSGEGSTRDDVGLTLVQAGDAFVFKPGEAHQLINTGKEDLVIYVVADNPVGESCHISRQWEMACALAPNSTHSVSWTGLL